MDRIKDFILGLQFISRPKYWFMNYSYNKEWDEKVKSLLKNNRFIKMCSYRAKLGDTILWIENHPYASFCTGTPSLTNKEYRPSRLTIHRAKKKLDKEAKFIQETKPLTTLEIRGINQQIEELKNIIRNHPENQTTYKKEGNLLNETKIRKHTFKHG